VATQELSGTRAGVDHQATPRPRGQFTPEARERYLSHLNADGHVRTDAGVWLADEIGEHLFVVDVKVDYVSPVVGDVLYGTMTAADGTGKALIIADAQDLAEAEGWMGRTVRLAGRATLLFGQPAIDLRRVVGGGR